VGVNSQGFLYMYDTAFYDGQVEGSLESARIILSNIKDFFIPKSIIDIGCGRGTWLTMGREIFGANIVDGIDGAWVSSQNIGCGFNFIPCELSTSLPNIKNRYDFALCLEVAEHLPNSKSDELVNYLCNISDVILFGAAICGQGGTGHVNEQWQSYWVSKFQKNDFLPWDIIRPKVWGNTSVNWWYSQNTILYINKNSESININFDIIKQLPRMPVYDVGHPLLVEKLKRKAR
jgi:hypothetical protein